MINKDLAKRLKQIYQVLDYKNHSDFAKAIGTTKEMLSCIFNFKKRITYSILMNLIYNLGISPNWFYLGLGEMLIKDETSQEGKDKSSRTSSKLTNILQMVADNNSGLVKNNGTLAGSNDKLADSTKIMAGSNDKLVNSNSILIGTNKKLSDRVISFNTYSS